MLALERKGYGEYVCGQGEYDLAGLLKLFPRDYRAREAAHMAPVVVVVDVRVVQNVSYDLGGLLYDLSRLQSAAAGKLAAPLEAVREQLERVEQQPDDAKALQAAQSAWEKFMRLFDAAEANLDKADKFTGRVAKIGAQLAKLWGVAHGLPL